MSRIVERLAMADAMQLHAERVESARHEVGRLRDELERAEIRARFVAKARADFIAAIEEPTND